MIRAKRTGRDLKQTGFARGKHQLRFHHGGTRILSERDVNNATYDAMREELEKYSGKTILIAGGRLLGVYKDPRSAAIDLRKRAPAARHAIITVVGKDKREELEWLGGSLSL